MTERITLTRVKSEPKQSPEEQTAHSSGDPSQEAQKMPKSKKQNLAAIIVKTEETEDLILTTYGCGCVDKHWKRASSLTGTTWAGTDFCLHHGGKADLFEIEEPKTDGGITLMSPTSSTKPKKTSSKKATVPVLKGRASLTWNFAVIVPKKMHSSLPFRHKDKLDIEIVDDSLVITKSKTK